MVMVGFSAESDKGTKAHFSTSAVRGRVLIPLIFNAISRVFFVVVAAATAAVLLYSTLTLSIRCSA